MRFAILAALLLAACAGADPPLAPDVRPVASGSTETLRFNALNLGHMRRGMQIGRYVWDIRCGMPYERVFWKSGLGFRRENSFRERFAEVFEDAGFDVAGAAYADGADKQRARYVVTGELREVRLELCQRQHWLITSEKGISGTGSVKIDWIVYASEDQRVVHRTSTTGHAVLDDGVPEGDVLLIEDGFSSAATGLAADPDFRAAVARGGSPMPAMGGASAGPSPTPEPTPEPIHATSLRLTGPPPFPGLLDDNTTRIADTVVRVGSGRGVVVGEVGGEALVLAPRAPDDTVSVQAGRVTLQGTVARRDAASGLMLVRVPARLTALPLRTAALEVSEPVHATADGMVFAPGIVGGLGVGVLQADLEGPAPQPGDPLLDEAGNLVGLALAGRREAGLTPFVPVADALAALGVVPVRTHANLDGRGRPPT